MLRELLDKLTAEQQKLLLYSLEEGASRYIRVGETHFIGVNVAGIPNLEILDKKNQWACGRVVE